MPKVLIVLTTLLTLASPAVAQQPAKGVSEAAIVFGSFLTALPPEGEPVLLRLGGGAGKGLAEWARVRLRRWLRHARQRRHTDGRADLQVPHEQQRQAIRSRRGDLGLQHRRFRRRHVGERGWRRREMDKRTLGTEV